MRLRWRFWGGVLLVGLILLASAGVALAAPPLDKVVESDETVDDDIVVFDGDLEVTAGATVNGDVVIFNGDARIAGEVNGDVVLFNGDLIAEDSAVISGDCVVLNGKIEGENLSCTDVVVSPATAEFLAALRNPDGSWRVSFPDNEGRFWPRLMGTIGRTILLSLLAFALATLQPRRLQRVETAVRRQPVASGIVGVLTAVAVPSIIALLLPISILLTLICIGLLGFPIILALTLGLIFASIFGWVAVGDLAGQRLAQALGLTDLSPATTAMLGTAVLTFTFGLLSTIPFIIGESLVSFTILAIGLGAVALTRFGTTSYPSLEPVKANTDKITAVLDTLPPDDEETL